MIYDITKTRFLSNETFLKISKHCVTDILESISSWHHVVNKQKKPKNIIWPAWPKPVVIFTWTCNFKKSEILLKNKFPDSLMGQTSQQIWKGDIFLILLIFCKGRSKSLHHFLFISTHFGKTLTLSTLTSQFSTEEEER